MKFNLHSLVVRLGTIAGAVSGPLGLLSPKAGAVVTIVGAVYSAFTKPAVQLKAKTPTPSAK